MTRGAVWSVPVIGVAAAAPAYAASCYSAPVHTMNLSSTSTGNGQKGTGTDGTTLTATRTSTPNSLGRGPYNLRTDDPDGPSGGWLEFENLPRSSAGAANPTWYQDITLTFSQPVYDLSLAIRDLDTSGYTTGIFNPVQAYRYWDHVAIVSAAGLTWTSTNGGDVTGNGTTGNPWRQTTFTNSASSHGDTAHRTTVTFTSPVTSFTFRYWSREGRSDYDGTQAVWIGNMTYKTNCNPTP